MSKRDSLALKGLAISFILAHHLFTGDGAMLTTFPVVGRHFGSMVAGYFIVGVSIFAFITAYGMSAKLDNKNLDNIHLQNTLIKRYANLMFPYWLVFAVFTILCNLFPYAERTFTDVYGTGRLRAVLRFVIDMMGLANAFHHSTINPTWWYMSLALLLIAIMPIIAAAAKKLGMALPLGAIIFVYALKLGGIHYCRYFIIACLGAGIYYSDFFGTLDKIFKKKSVTGNLILATCILVLFGAGFYLGRFKVVKLVGVGWALSTLSYVILQVRFIGKIEPLMKLLCFFGKHSMNIFLVHTFIKTYFFHGPLYSLTYAPIIWAALMASSIIVSITLDAIYKLLKVDRIKSKVVDALSRPTEALECGESN